MGRKKIAIKKILDNRQRTVTFARRRNGIMKKAHELSVLCDCQVALLVFDANDRCHSYCSTNLDKLLLKYTKKNFEEMETNESLKEVFQMLSQNGEQQNNTSSDDTDDSDNESIDISEGTASNMEGSVKDTMITNNGGQDMQSIKSVSPLLAKMSHDEAKNAKSALYSHWKMPNNSFYRKEGLSTPALIQPDEKLISEHRQTQHICIAPSVQSKKKTADMRTALFRFHQSQRQKANPSPNMLFTNEMMNEDVPFSISPAQFTEADNINLGGIPNVEMNNEEVFLNQEWSLDSLISGGPESPFADMSPLNKPFMDWPYSPNPSPSRPISPSYQTLGASFSPMSLMDARTELLN